MKVYIYCRVSQSNGNKGWGANSNIQLDECIKFCRLQEWYDRIQDTIVYDQENSGWKGGNMDSLSQITKEMSKGDILLVHTIDRISRNTLKGIQFLESLSKKGCRIISVTENVTYDENDIYGRFEFRNIINHAELESDRISQRQKRTARFRKTKNRVSATKFQCYNTNTNTNTNTNKRKRKNIIDKPKVSKVQTKNMAKRIMRNNLLRGSLEKYNLE